MGLWRHRARYTLGEALLCMGDLERAEPAFVRSAEIGALAEPPFEGFAHCTAALAAARSGALDRALGLALGPRGLALVQHRGFMLQRFASVGISAELLARAGRTDEALELAEQALTLSRTRRDVNVFFAALHGHTGTLFALCSALEQAEGKQASQLYTKAKRALAELRRFVRMYPVTHPIYAEARERLQRNSSR